MKQERNVNEKRTINGLLMFEVPEWDDDDEQHREGARAHQARVVERSALKRNVLSSREAETSSHDGAGARPKQRRRRTGYEGYLPQKGETDVDVVDVPPIENEASYEAFVSHFSKTYVMGRRPALLRPPAGGTIVEGVRWGTPPFSLEAMRSNERIARVRVRVEKRSRTDSSNQFGHGEYTHMSMRTLVSALEADGNTSLYLTTQDDEFDVDGRPQLLTRPLNTFYNVAREKGGSGAAFPLRPSILRSLVPASINLWLGSSPSERPTSSGLHHDYHDNLYNVLSGRKTFRLFPPSDARFLYPQGQVACIHHNGLISYAHDAACDADGWNEAAMAAVHRRMRRRRRMENAEHTARKRRAAAALSRGGADDGGASGELYGSSADDEDMEAAMEAMLQEARVDGASSGEDDYDDSDDDDDDDNDDRNDTDGDKARTESASRRLPPSFSRIGSCVFYKDEQERTSQFPLLRRARMLRCDVHQGECLYLPASWWHEVISSSAPQGQHEEKAKVHAALNFWFHPPSAPNASGRPYVHGRWEEDFREVSALISRSGV